MRPMLGDRRMPLSTPTQRTNSLMSYRTRLACSFQSCTSKLSFWMNFSKICSSMLPQQTCSSHSRLTLQRSSSSISTGDWVLRKLCIMNSIFSIFMMLSLTSSHSVSSLRISNPDYPETFLSKQSASSSKISDLVILVYYSFCSFYFRRFWQLLRRATSCSWYFAVSQRRASSCLGKQLSLKQGSQSYYRAYLKAVSIALAEMIPYWMRLQDCSILSCSCCSIYLMFEFKGLWVRMFFSSRSSREAMVAATCRQAYFSLSANTCTRCLYRRHCCMALVNCLTRVTLASRSISCFPFLHSFRPRYTRMILSLPIPMIRLRARMFTATSCIFLSILCVKLLKLSRLVYLFQKKVMSYCRYAPILCSRSAQQSLKMCPKKKALKMSETISLVNAMLDWKTLEMSLLFSFWPRVTWKMRRLKTQSGLMRNGSNSRSRFLQLARKLTLLSGSSKYSQRLSYWYSLSMLLRNLCITSSSGWQCCMQSSSWASRQLQIASMLMEVKTCALLIPSQWSLTTFTFARQVLKLPSRKIRMSSLSAICLHSYSIRFCSTVSSSILQVIWSRMRVKFRRISSLFCRTCRSCPMVQKKAYPNSRIFSVLMMLRLSNSSVWLISMRQRLSSRPSPRGLLKSLRLILSERWRLSEGSSSRMEQFFRRCSSTSFRRVYSVIISNSLLQTHRQKPSRKVYCWRQCLA